ncbi:probable sodium/potassium/calcium exchanger CG1090 [Galendromus occidentalis]|uniref:Probable sodium/potassium/calcium exchanger CG1090 n=1 Tax=Galendromus occidentalis TaxID=34638 RepID=A0AAJ6VWT0_9ACAR|nr:probable sodium/potassium/calcium exchanger CG1090 [Galendromus occidentalis]
MNMQHFGWLMIFSIFVIGPLAATAEDSSSGPTKSGVSIPASNLTRPLGHKHTILVEGREVRCTPAAIEEFPRPFLDAKTRARGGILVYVFLAICIILTISVLCKEYFVPAQDCLIKYLGMNSDVAGATIMAAASSIPALVTSVIGVNVVENDLGLSTTLGSGVLNAAGVLSVCALFADRSVELHAWPLVRGSFFFLLSMLIVLFALMDSEVDWIEATVCLLAYALYTLAHVYNGPLERFFKYVTGLQDRDERDLTIVDSRVRSQAIIMETIVDGFCVISDIDDMTAKKLKAKGKDCKLAKARPETDPKAWGNLSLGRKIFRILTAPSAKILSYVIPNCKKPGFEKYFLLTFVMSGALIATLSYSLVWMMAVIGFTLGIPDSVLGLTLMSFSVTLPDVMAAVLVVRKGYGDMVVSYVLGTNIFEVLVGLGLPWLVQTTIIKPGIAIELQSEGLIYSTASVLFTVILVPTLTYATRWKMNKTYGAILLVWYLTFMIFSCLYQMNFFNDSNPPSCGSLY